MNTKQIEQTLLNKIKKNQEQTDFRQPADLIIGLSALAIILSCLAWLVMWIKP